MAKRSLEGGRRCEAVWSLLARRYSKVSGRLFNRAWDSSAVAYAYGPLPSVQSPTEELMTAPHTQELLRPEEVDYWVDPVRGRTDEERRSPDGR
jgi:hypothetical protein